ncbi:MAG: hypothetical protein AB7V56_09410 [Candidatus Nitrosocosmicus sp.]
MLEKELFNLPYDDIVVDFSDINLINQEFIVLYLLCKSNCSKEIREVNLPLELLKVFDS